MIRKYRKGDGTSFFELLERNDNRQHLKEHVNEATTVTTLEEADKRIQELISNWDKKERFVMGMWLKTFNLYVGQIWIEPKNWDVPRFELGWFLDKSYQGQGLATEAVKRSIDYLFDDFKLHKIVVLVRNDNLRSKKLAERCGFIKEGRLRDHGIINGKRIDLVCYGLLKNEYRLKKRLE